MKMEINPLQRWIKVMAREKETRHLLTYLAGHAFRCDGKLEN